MKTALQVIGFFFVILVLPGLIVQLGGQAGAYFMAGVGVVYFGSIAFAFIGVFVEWFINAYNGKG